MKTRTFCSFLIFCALIACAVPVVQADDIAVANESVDEAVRLYNHADLAIASGDYEGALEMLNQALALNTSQFVSSGARGYALLDKSKVLIELGDFENALGVIDEALALEETDKLWNNRGYVLYRLGRYDEAVSAYNTAIKITPDYTVALINKGDAQMALKDYTGAIASYNAAFASDAEANDLSFAQKAITGKDLGDAYAAVGNYPAAIAAYKDSLGNDPGNAETTAALERAQQQADTGTMVFVAGGMAVLVIAGLGAYYLLKKKGAEPAEEKGKKKK